jgi:hypothetical protein
MSTATRIQPSRTPHFHYASMRNAEQSARDLSVQLQARTFLHAVTDEVLDAELADLKAARTSFYLLASAHRNAARRLERGQRIRSRVERIVRPVVRGALRVRRAVTV